MTPPIIPAREYLNWIERKLAADRKWLFSILECWGVPLPAPRAWEKEWEKEWEG